MSKIVWAFDAEVCALLDETKLVCSHLLELDGEQFLDRVPELLRRIEVLEQQPEFHHYFSQAAVRIAGEAVGYVSLHAETIDELQQFLRSIEGHDVASEAMQVANMAGIVGESVGEVATRKQQLRSEAAVAAEIAGESSSPRAGEFAGNRPAAPQSASQPDTSSHLPIVNLELNQVRLRGKCFDLSTEGTLLVHTVVDNFPHYVAAYKFSSKPSDVKNCLPDEIRQHIETTSGKGYRWRT